MSKEKKIPTIVAIFILIIVVFVTTYLTKLTAIFTSKASNGCSPISIQITNLTDHSVDLSFLTPEKCSVNLGINNQLVLDSFQLIEPQSQIHYFQVNGLKENSSYQYTIIANGKEIENDQFVISTPAKLDGPIPDSNLAWGKIIQSNQQPASIAILYLNIPSSAPMSSFVTSEGNWNIPLSISYNTQKSSWFVPPENVEEEIAVLSKDGQVTLVTGNTSNNNPVPDIIIGHGFSSDENNNREQDIGNMPVTQQQPDQAIEKELDIINPKDGEFLSTQQPEFFGTAPQGVILKIELHSSDQFDSEIQSDSSGNWRWSSPQSLSPGQHSLTISFLNPKTGLKESITKSFVVLAAQDNPGFTASSSAQPTNIPTLTPTSTFTPTPVLTLSPTSTSTPTQTPSLTPTITIRTAKPSTDSQVPTTGFTLPTTLPLLLSIPAIIIALLLI